jgi:hypothetical protein
MSEILSKMGGLIVPVRTEELISYNQDGYVVLQVQRIQSNLFGQNVNLAD